MAGANNQANKGAAALINAERMLRERIGESGVTSGPDRNTFIYSVTLNLGIMEMWVHWAEILGSDVKYHMRLLEA